MKQLSLPQSIHDHAKLNSEKSAVESASLSLSYGELSILSHRVCTSLLEHGVALGDRVGIFVEHLAWAYPALSGTLQAGAVYVPLNSEFPDSRLAEMASDAGLSAILCESSLLARAQEMSTQGDAVIILLDREQASVQTTPQVLALSAVTSAPIHTSQPEDLAYIMYTSGTTGKPKGVTISHGAVSSFIGWSMDHFQLCAEDRFSQHSRLSFDLSIFDMFSCFCSGGTLCPIEIKVDLAFPGNFLRKNRITIMLCVPGVIGMMDRAQQLSLDYSGSLRHLLVCGEALPPSYAQRWLETQPTILLHNLYGPTEATVACSAHLVQATDVSGNPESISIGQATRDTELFLLSDDLKQEVATGQVGKLMLGGAQLSHGYWQRPDLNEKAFCTHPINQIRLYDSGDLAKVNENGQLLWMGRADQQVNINGYRVELMEIEGHANASGLFSECAIVAHGTPLSLYAVFSHQEELDSQSLFEKLKKELSQQLPEYMVPRQFHVMDALPRNNNGKINRKAVLKILDA